MKVINLLAGPGAGQSTMAEMLFAELKMRQVNVELVTAKDLVWDEASMADQGYITATQYHRIYRLIDKVDVVVTDSPIITGLRYVASDPLRQFVLSLHHDTRFDNWNYFVSRVVGRNQTEFEALEKDHEMLTLLRDEAINFRLVSGDSQGVESILHDLGYYGCHGRRLYLNR